MSTRQKLVAFRESRGLTQQQVADKLGITRSFYCRLEGGIRGAKPALLKRFAACFGLTMDQAYELFYGDDVTKTSRQAGTGTDG
jgi:transcriptional regulator with XRE-family HTH domain